MPQVIQLRRDTAAAWATENPILAEGEKGIEIDTGNEKTGDGVTAWNSLSYFGGSGGGGDVSSVNGQIGVVVLDSDDIDDTGASHRFATVAQLTKLDGIEALADVTDTANVSAAGAAMRASNLSDLLSASSARTNLGLGALATKGSLTVFHDVYLSIPADAAQGDFSTVWSAPRPGNLVEYEGQVAIAPVTAAILLDLNKNGTSVMGAGSGRVSIPTGQLRDVSGTPTTLPFTTSDLFQIEIDQLNAADQGDVGIITVRITWSEVIS